MDEFVALMGVEQIGNAGNEKELDLGVEGEYCCAHNECAHIWSEHRWALDVQGDLRVGKCLKEGCRCATFR